MCGITYANQAKLIAWMEIITSVVGFTFVSLSTLILGLDSELRNRILHDEDNNLYSIILHFSIPEKVTSVAIPIIYFIFEFILAVFLYRSVIYRHYKNLRAWYIVTITICISSVYWFLPGVFFTDESLYFIAIFIGSYAFTAYSVWVVYSLMAEMKRDGLHFPVITYEDDAEKL